MPYHSISPTAEVTVFLENILGVADFNYFETLVKMTPEIQISPPFAVYPMKPDMNFQTNYGGFY